MQMNNSLAVRHSIRLGTIISFIFSTNMIDWTWHMYIQLDLISLRAPFVTLAMAFPSAFVI